MWVISYNPTLFEASDWWKASNCGTMSDVAHFARLVIGGKQPTEQNMDKTFAWAGSAIHLDEPEIYIPT